MGQLATGLLGGKGHKVAMYSFWLTTQRRQRQRPSARSATQSNSRPLRAVSSAVRSWIVGAGVAVLLSQPSTAWAQGAGPDLVIAMSHHGNFTVGTNGVYTIVITNIGGTATDAASGSIFVADRLKRTPPLFRPAPGFPFVSMRGTGLNFFR